MSSKKIATILILVIVITFVQVILRQNNDRKDNGKVKSAQTQKDSINLPDVNDIKLQLPPVLNSQSQPSIWAKSYILRDVDSGYVLIEKESDLSVPIASTTKIMTAIIALENYKLDDIITISSNAAHQIGSDVYLQSNEKMSVENLLYALLVKSGNDAAMALAEQMGIDSFLEKMNEKAQFLGMNSTHYLDPAGLNDSGRSTARDLSIAAAYALKNEFFQKIVRTSEITITSSDGKIAHKLENSNRLVKNDEPLYFPDSIGIKTGYTPDAGHCLVSAANRNGHTIISVILNTSQSTNDASAKESKKLLEWGFDNFTWSNN